MITFITLADISAMDDLDKANTLNILRSLRQFRTTDTPLLAILPIPIEESGLDQLSRSCDDLFGLDSGFLEESLFLDMYVDDHSLRTLRFAEFPF